MVCTRRIPPIARPIKSAPHRTMTSIVNEPELDVNDDRDRLLKREWLSLSIWLPLGMISYPLLNRPRGCAAHRDMRTERVPSSIARRTALALNSSLNWRQARRLDVSAIGVDIVFPFGKMSTESTMKWPSLSSSISSVADSDV
jgi:hypothetical protein